MNACILLAALLLPAAAGDSPDADYLEARAAAMRTGHPLIVLVGAEWCHACPAAHRLLPQLREKGECVYLDWDKRRALVQLVAPGPMVPRLAIWHQDPSGTWSCTIYVGADRIRQYAEGPPQPVNPGRK